MLVRLALGPSNFQRALATMNDHDATNDTDGDTDAVEAARQSVLSFLLIQTYLDGGACYATAYRDAYDTPKALPSLLRAGKCGKLMQFMESKHVRQYLIISDRSKPPHVVSLTDAGRQRAAKLLEGFLADKNGEYKSQLQSAEEALKERLIYRLRQNYCKLRRRRANRKADDAIDEPIDDPNGCSLPWLVKKCPKELHMFARLQPNRPMDVLPLSKDWNSKVESILLNLINRHADTVFVVGEHKGAAHVRVSVGLVQSLQGEEEDEGGSNSIDLEGVRTMLVGILRERGNAVGGLDVGNIMTDEKMRQLLGGRDLTTVVQGNSAAFDPSVEMYQDELRNNVWYCRLTDFDFAGANQDTCGSKRKKDLLHADEVGTYSLTDATSALAMAKVLANAMHTEEASKAEASRVAIDMTAGVGGNTIGLCKIYPKVIAYEIDSSRIEFLKRNVNARVSASDVDVTLRCGDSLLALDSLLAELRADGIDVSKQVAVIIDPPFGGIHYRRRGSKMVPNGDQGGDDGDYDEEGLKLGDMPLSEVVKTVMGKLNPSAIGLKLPLTFDVDRFAEKLEGSSKDGNGAGNDKDTLADMEDMMIALKVRAIRRLARNLFVVVVKSE